MAFQVFVDGAEGTTGLVINERLAMREDIEMLTIAPELRKDSSARRALIHQADAVFLCLPDDAARESASLAEGSNAVVIDASTAHRTNDAWAYGFPELSALHQAKVRGSKRISVPGCHATGLIATVYPLIAAGVMGANYPVSAHSITGYSGGGKKMIAEYQDEGRSIAYDSPRQYGLPLKHKHLPEMQKMSGLSEVPLFNPIVCDFYAGMAVSVPVYARLLRKRLGLKDMIALLSEHYAGQAFVRVSAQPEDGFLPANLNTGTNNLTIYVCGNDEQMTLVSVFDNLGKGASGAAVQCMNIALGLDERIGL